MLRARRGRHALQRALKRVWRPVRAAHALAAPADRRAHGAGYDGRAARLRAVMLMRRRGGRARLLHNDDGRAALLSEAVATVVTVVVVVVVVAARSLPRVLFRGSSRRPPRRIGQIARARAAIWPYARYQALRPFALFCRVPGAAAAAVQSHLAALNCVAPLTRVALRYHDVRDTVLRFTFVRQPFVRALWLYRTAPTLDTSGQAGEQQAQLMQPLQQQKNSVVDAAVALWRGEEVRADGGRGDRG